MRSAIVLILVGVLVPSCAGGAAPAVRQLPGLDLGLFTCAPNRGHYLIGSQLELMRVIATLAPHCSPTVGEQRKAALLRDLERADVKWSEEVLVIAQDWYGTGMAKPSLTFSAPSDRSLTVTVHWEVPPPPVTPDTASCTFAFTVRRSAVSEIQVVGSNSGTATFAVSAQLASSP